jgi:hypothetical protein
VTTVASLFNPEFKIVSGLPPHKKFKFDGSFFIFIQSFISFESIFVVLFSYILKL